MSYRPDIDGLRAVAVLSVLFYHAHLGFPGGYVGVDIFFVISGFLITGLLLKAITKGTFSYIDFWERRVRRLVPALAVVTLFAAVTSYFILLPEDLNDLGGALIAQPLLLSNVYFWRAVKRGYFGDPPEIRPLLHTWSLGVEEQFYVLFPLLLMMILKRQFVARHIGKILAGLTIASFSLAVAVTPAKAVLSFFTLPTRAWELLLGSLLALSLAPLSPTHKTLPPPPPKAPHELSALLGLGLISYSIAFYHDKTPFPGYAALVPCLGTALLIWANSHSNLTFVGRLFSHPIMVRVGQISYSLYLWHWPLIAYGDYLFLLQSTEARWLVVILSCWLGYLSWRWVETPFREKRWLTSRRAIFGLFLTYAVTCLCLGTAYRLIQDSPLLPPKPTRSGIFEADLDRPNQKLPSLGRESEPVSFLLWGDSHAMSLAPLLNALGAEYGTHGLQLTYSAVAPLLTWDYPPTSKKLVSEEFKKKWAHRALGTATSHNVKIVFLVAFWKSYSGPHFSQELQQTVHEFNRRGVHVVFVADNPEQLTDPVRHTRLSFQEDWIAKPTLIPSKEHQQKNAVIYEALATSPLPSAEFTTIDLAPSVLKWRNFLSEDGQLLYADNNHLSDEGALKLRPLFEPIFEELVQNQQTPYGEGLKLREGIAP